MLEKSNICGSGCAGVILASFCVTAILITAAFACGVLAQRAIDPARVIIRAPKDAINDPLVAAVTQELRDRRIVIAQQKGDFDLQLNAMPLVGCEGYAVAVLLTDRDTGAGILRAYTSATIGGLAWQVVRDLDVDMRAKQRSKEWRSLR